MWKIFLIAAALVLAATQDAAQLKLLIDGAMSEPFKAVGADFSRQTGTSIDFTADTTGALQKRLRAGEKADIILLSAPGMDALEREHLIARGVASSSQRA